MAFSRFRVFARRAYLGKESMKKAPSAATPGATPAPGSSVASGSRAKAPPGRQPPQLSPLGRLVAFLGGVGAGTTIPEDVLTEAAVNGVTNAAEGIISSGAGTLARIGTSKLRKSILGDPCRREILDNGSLVIYADLPGLGPSDVVVTCKDNRMYVIGTAGGAFAGKSCEFRVPSWLQEYDTSKAKGVLDKGQLRIVIPQGRTPEGVFTVELDH